MEKAGNKGCRFLRSHGFSGETVDEFRLIINELIENAIKYGNFSGSGKKITTEIHVDDRMITVEVTNPVDEKADTHLKILDRTIRWIRGFQDPFEPYMRKVQDIPGSPLVNEAGGGLGLARVAYEGKAILDFFVDEDHVLNVTALKNYENQSQSVPG